MKKRIKGILRLSALALLIGTGIFGSVADAYAQQPEGTSAEMPWFVPLSFGGFNFEIPAGAIVEKGENMVVKYPDGSFGMSISTAPSTGTEQQAAFLMTRQLVDQLKLTDAHVTKETIAGVKGAKCTGTLDGTTVTILVLPLGSKDTTTIMMAAPSRSAWVEHFLKSLSR